MNAEQAFREHMAQLAVDVQLDERAALLLTDRLKHAPAARLWALNRSRRATARRSFTDAELALGSYDEVYRS